MAEKIQTALRRNQVEILLLFGLLAMTLFGALLSGCGSGIKKLGNAPKGTTEYIITEHYSTTDTAKEYIRKRESNGLCEKGELDAEGHIHLYVTEEQRNTWIKEAEESMNEIEDSGKSDNIDYDFSRDYTKFTITASKGCNIKHMATILHQALFDAELYQVFRDQQDWKLLVVIVNRDTGKEVLTAEQPESGILLDETLWDSK